MVKVPEEYPWNSYRYYVGQGKSPEWINIRWLLEEFGGTFKISHKRYSEFVEPGIKKQLEFPEDKIVGQAILGSEVFASRILEGIKKDKRFDEITGKRIFSDQINIDKLYRIVCEHYKIVGLGENEQRGVGLKKEREMFIYLAKEQTSA